MTPQEINERLYELISDKDFDSLTEAEQAWIRKHSDEATYRSLRKAHLGIAEVESSELPEPPPISEKMKAALEQRRSGQSTELVWFLRQPIPLWQAAASVLVVVGLFFLFARQEKTPSHIILQMGDTLEVSNPNFTATWHKDTLILTEQKTTAPQPAPSENLAVNEDQNVAGLSIYSIDQMTKAQPNGKSMAEDSLLRQFEIVSM